MSKKSNTIVPKVSYKFPLRRGQKEALNYFKTNLSGVFQLPTGYGKTRVIDECFAHCYHNEIAEKMLLIFPRVNQLEQYRRENPYAVDLSKQSDVSILKDYNNGANVFLITAHSLVSKYDKVQHYLHGEDVFVAVDEIQYYGTEKNKEGDIVDKTWCEYINKLHNDMNVLMIGLSATPKKGDATCNLFDDVNITMSYREAMAEVAVKPLAGYSYRYSVNITNKYGEVVELTTEDLGKLYGTKPQRDEVCDRYGLEYDQKTNYFKEMRESIKYVQPLVKKPIDRLVKTSLEVGFRPQMIINTYSINEAKSVANQINSFSSGMKVEWIGVGKEVKDKSEREIADITRRFLRKPLANQEYFDESEHIDILINFKRAAVGLDSVTVTEIVFLTGTNPSDFLKQQIGRGSRTIHGYPNLKCNISFDSSSYLGRENYIGPNLIAFMDDEIPSMVSTPSEKKSFDEYIDSFDFSFNLSKLVNDVNFLEVIRKEDAVFEIQALEKDNASIDGTNIVMDELYDDKGNPVENPLWDKLTKVISHAHEIKQKPIIEEKSREVKRDKISKKANSFSKVLIDKMSEMSSNGYTIPANVINDQWKIVNVLKRAFAGPIEDSEESIERHAYFLRAFGQYLELNIKKESFNLSRKVVFDWINNNYHE